MLLVKLLLLIILAVLFINSEALKRLPKAKGKDLVKHLGEQPALRVVAAKQLALMSQGETAKRQDLQEAIKQNRIQKDEEDYIDYQEALSSLSTHSFLISDYLDYDDSS